MELSCLGESRQAFKGIHEEEEKTQGDRPRRASKRPQKSGAGRAQGCPSHAAGEGRRLPLRPALVRRGQWAPKLTIRRLRTQLGARAQAPGSTSWRLRADTDFPAGLSRTGAAFEREAQSRDPPYIKTLYHGLRKR